MHCLLEKGHLGIPFTKQQQNYSEWAWGNTFVTLLIEDFYENFFLLKGYKKTYIYFPESQSLEHLLISA